MKKVYWFSVLIFLFTNVFASEHPVKEVPKNVSFRFYYQHPGASGVTWFKNENTYVAKYKENDKELSVYYTIGADCVEIDREIEIKDLPVQFHPKLQYALGDKYSVQQIISVDDFTGTPYYLVKATSKKSKENIYFMLEGKNEIILYDVKQGVVVW